MFQYRKLQLQISSFIFNVIFEITQQKFDQFNLKKELLHGIFAYGFEQPSSIQCLAIPKILTGKDIIVQAQSGTGKTATFTISLLQRLDESKKQPQILILSPTRELAQQTYNVVTNIGQKMQISSVLLYGGQSMDVDREKCKQNPQIVVGCPGRVQQMIKEGCLDTRNMTMHIIDEADEMFEKNFSEQMTYVMQHVPEKAQMVLVSATMPKEVVELTQQFMANAEKILVKEDELKLEGIRQYKMKLEEGWKQSALFDIVKVLKIQQCVIFVNKIQRVEELYEEMKKENFNPLQITSAMEQSERNEVMKSFKDGQSRYLIGTDIIARGIDVQNVTCVINYDMPRSAETYLHRIGRSGRYGRKGIAINFVTQRNEEILKNIEEKYQVQIEELPKDLTNII